MNDLGLLVLRVGLGGLMMGHGGQKLFGWWRGHGPEGTGKMMESLGLSPGGFWARLAGASEFSGGGMTALGLMHPLGPLAILGSMAMATFKAHADRPIWVTEGGAELPVTNSFIALALLLTGPGIFSVDRALGLRMSPVSQAVVILAGIGALAYGLQPAEEPSPTAR
ncbi:MAG TPA: DoxX family protein [Chloroflexota bacterium]|jgi:putative oxidoreductase|nr:DoxX family protein [Chloroflexota bacterium]